MAVVAVEVDFGDRLPPKKVYLRYGPFDHLLSGKDHVRQILRGVELARANKVSTTILRGGETVPYSAWIIAGETNVEQMRVGFYAGPKLPNSLLVPVRRISYMLKDTPKKRRRLKLFQQFARLMGAQLVSA